MANLQVKLHDKECSCCKQVLELVYFRKNHNKCKDCENKRNKDYYNKNKVVLLEKARIKNTNPFTFEERKNKWLLKRYGITYSIYKEMAESQDNSCKICKKESYDLVVDHCHSTNKVRGLLCQPCNKGLGMFEDNKDYLKEAIDYLNND